MQHLDDGVIQELVDGEIASRDLPPLQAHLASCDACRARLEMARMAASETDELLLMLDEVEPSAPVTAPVVLPISRPHWSRNLAWAASLLLAVGLGYAGRDTINGVLGAPEPEASADLVAPTVRGVPTAPPTAPTETATPRREAAEPLTNGVGNVAERLTSPTSARNDAAATTQPAQELARDQAAPVPAPAIVGAASGAGVEAAPQSTRALAEQESSAGLRAETRRRTVPQTQPSALAPARPAGSLELADAAKSMVAAQAIEFPAALRILGGTIKLIDGMVPQRVDAAGGEVMVVYRVAQGELLLVQRRVADSLNWRLAAPVGFPADSLAVLRGRVKP